MKYEWMNAACLSSVLGSCIIPSVTEPVEGRFRPGRISFSTYWHGWFISQIKVLASLSCWPDDLGCHIFIHAKWLVLWYVSIAQKPCTRKKGKILPLRSPYYPAEPVLWLLWKCSRAYWCQPNQFGAVVQYERSRKQAHLVNTAAPERATLKHSCMIKRWLIKLERIYSLFLHGSACW